MELILWRHAEAEDGVPDLERRLTPRGVKQAAKMAAWLQPILTADWLILASPARRTVQTAEALGVPFDLREALGTWSTAEAVLEEIKWPDAQRPVLVIGHQPTLGHIAARLLSGRDGDVAVRKGAAWWFATRVRDGERETTLKAVMNPDLLAG